MAASPRCARCDELLSIDGFHPARKELRCVGCGHLAIVLRGRARQPIPIPDGLEVRVDGERLTIDRDRGWLRRDDRIEVGGGRLVARGGPALDVADVVQIYVVRGAPGALEVRALDHGGASRPLLRTPCLWQALAIEHFIERHLRLLDVRIG